MPSFFVESQENHLTPALFQTWAAFPGASWASALLSAANVSVQGRVHRTTWSYQYQEKATVGHCIADVVLCWADDAGTAVLVLEAKRPGGSLGPKDSDPPYLRMAGLARTSSRQHYAVVVDAADVDKASKSVRDHTVMTWQDMVAAQIEAAKAMQLSSEVSSLLISSIVHHAEQRRVSPACGTSGSVDVKQLAVGSLHRYQELAELPGPSSIVAFLVGADSCFSALTTSRLPDPPYDWLNQEPVVPNLPKLAGDDWYAPIWRFDWTPEQLSSA